MTDSTTTTTTGAPRRHIAVCPFPFSSHPTTLFLLSHKISASAPDAHVSFFTTESTAAALTASMSAEGGNVRMYRIHDGMAEGNKAANLLEAVRMFMETAGESIRRSMAAAVEEVGVKISCVVADAFLSHLCREIAEEEGVKWAALWVSSAASLAAHIHTDDLRSRIGSVEGIEAHKDQTTDQFIPGFPPIPISDLPYEVLAADLSSSVARVLHLMSLNLPKATAVVINSFHHLESAVIVTLNTTLGNKFLSAGPYSLTLPSPVLAAQDRQGCLPWLDTHLTSPASVLYIGFGTAHTPTPEEFIALAEALELVKVPFLWALPDRFMAQLPEGFTERTVKSGKGKVVSWAPQMLVLSHKAVGAQLTHCGWNSVMESIATCVPMICRPFEVADNGLNKSLVESVWGIGMTVEDGKLTSSAVATAVEKVLLGEEGRRMREKIGVMKRLVDEAVAEPAGSSAQNLQKFINIIVS